MIILCKKNRPTYLLLQTYSTNKSVIIIPVQPYVQHIIFSSQSKKKKIFALHFSLSLWFRFFLKDQLLILTDIRPVRNRISSSIHPETVKPVLKKVGLSQPAGYPEHPWYGEVRTISTGTSLSNDDIGKFTDIHYTENKYKLQYHRDLFHACTV